MDYEIFKKVMVQQIKGYLPSMYSSCQVSVCKVRKINQEKDTLLLTPKGIGGTLAIPNLYLDDMYQEFEKCRDIEKILHLASALITEHSSILPCPGDEIDFSSRRDFIVMNLIGEEYNRELLEGVPHKKFLDMAVIYRIIMKEDAHGMWTVLITDDLLKELNLTEEELDRLALENTKRLFPAMVTKMSDLFYVITNESKIHGATVLMYEEELKSLAEQLGGGFYLLPSSIHEVIAVPEDILTVKDLICILEEGNRMESVKNESLSNSIYYYCQEKETIFMAASYYAESFQY